jgi:hypothetical protein
MANMEMSIRLRWKSRVHALIEALSFLISKDFGSNKIDWGVVF